MQHLSSLPVNDVNDDASVAPALLEVVTFLIAFSRMERFVQKRPRQLLFSVDFQRSSCSDANVLSTEITVHLISVVRPVLTNKAFKYTKFEMSSAC